MKLRIVASAYRHGYTDNEIAHAWDNNLGFYDIDADHELPKGLCIGPDPAGNLVELLYLQFTDGDLIIHAQALRPVFRPYLSGDRPHHPIRQDNHLSSK